MLSTRTYRHLIVIRQIPDRYDEYQAYPPHILYSPIYQRSSHRCERDCSAKLEDKGEAGSGELVVNNMSIYQIADYGLALETMISGAKYCA